MNRKTFLATIGAAALFPRLSAASPKAIMPRPTVIPAALTPYDDDLRVDVSEFRRHIAALAAVPGVTGIMVNGGAGHDSTLSRDERRRLVAEALTAAGDRVQILAALRETSDHTTLAPFAKDAANEGAHALIVMPPSKKSDEAWEGARARFDNVFSAANLPVAIYQTGYDTETLTRLASLPAIFAIKEGNGSPAVFERNLRAIRALGRDVAVWSTHSRWLLSDLAVGADGILSGMGSVAADLHVALAEAVRRSDLAAARAVNDRLFPLTQVFYAPGHDPHTRMKYALKKLGRQQRDLVRPPRQPLDDVERAAIDRALFRSGLLAATGYETTPD